MKTKIQNTLILSLITSTLLSCDEQRLNRFSRDLEGVWQIDSVRRYWPRQDYVDTLNTENLGIFDFTACPEKSDEDCYMERKMPDGTLVPFLYNLTFDVDKNREITLSPSSNNDSFVSWQGVYEVDFSKNKKSVTFYHYYLNTSQLEIYLSR